MLEGYELTIWFSCIDDADGHYRDPATGEQIVNNIPDVVTIGLEWLSGSMDIEYRCWQEN